MPALMLMSTLLLPPPAVCELPAPDEVPAVSDSIPPEQGRPVVGLSLSGGGARGLAHIGVIKVLEEAGIGIDIVAGNSMGALLGGLYAAGYTASQLEEIAVGTDWMDLFENKSDRKHVSIESKDRMARYCFLLQIDGLGVHPTTGLLSGRKIYSLLSRLTWPTNEVRDFGSFPRPFRCVATDIATGECVVLERGSLADAMRASMAIPGVFEPLMIDGRLLVDGMLVRNFPGEDAREMGAEIIIGADVGSEPIRQEKIKSLLDIVNQSVILAHLPERRKQLSYADILITPEVGDFGSLDFPKAREIILRGEMAARERIEELRALAGFLGKWSPPPPVAGIETDTAIEICDLRVRGTRRVTRGYFLNSLGISLPAELTYDQLDETINRLYGMGSFKLIRYSFDRSSGCSVLDIEFEEDSGDYLRIGLRYDSYWGSALLLDSSVREIFGRYSDLEAEVMLGERFRAKGSLNKSRGFVNRIGVRTDFDWIEDELHIYSGAERTGKMDIWEIRGGIFAEYAFSRYLYWDLGMVTEWAQADPQVVTAGQEGEWTRINLVVSDIWIDSLDRAWFPQKGVLFRIKGEAADFGSINNFTFNRVSGKFLARLPLNDRISAGVRFLFGSTDRSGIPIHYRFFVGGLNSSMTFQGDRDVNFFGLEHEELSGRHAFILGFDAQFRLTRSLYLAAHFNTADAEDVFKDLLSTGEQIYGFGLTAGYSTPLGPLEFSMGHSERHDLTTFFSAGYRF